MNQPLSADQDVFKLIALISDYRQIYSHFGLGDIVNSSNPCNSVPCPKTPSAKKTSTKFRFKSGWESSGRWHHNDVDSGASQGPMEFVMWFFGISDPIDAAMTLLDAAGIEYKDLRGQSYNRVIPINKNITPLLTDEEIALRKQKKWGEAVRSIKRVAKTWEDALPLSHPVAAAALDRYLVHRGLPAGHVNNMPRHLKVSLNLYYPAFFRKENNPAYYAGLLIPVIDLDGQRVTCHRHYFDKITGEKVPEENRKMMMATPWEMPLGSYLEYDKPEIIIKDGIKHALYQVGEGVETMEAVRVLTDGPVQPMFSTGLLRNFTPKMEHIEGITPNNVYIDFFVDKDKPQEDDQFGRGPGEIAADIAIKRLSELGYQCQKYLPPLDIPDGEKGVDWLDAWNQLGHAALN